MAYLKNTIINFDNSDHTVLNKTYSVEDYRSLNLNKILDYIDNCEYDMFDWYQLQNNANLEKVALDLYGNPDYWDILIAINGHNPLFDLPFDFDVLESFSESKAQAYVDKVYGTELSEETNLELINSYREKFQTRNEELRVIRIVKPSMIQQFLQKGYEEGCFK